MTSLAGLYEWLVAGKAGEHTAENGRGPEEFRLRELPREDIHLHIKAIDNTKVVRVVDKKDWFASLGMSIGVLSVSVLLIALMLPGGYALLASHRIEQLKAQRLELRNQLNVLRSEEAKVLSPGQMEQWAGEKFIDPPAHAVVFTTPVDGTRVASLETR
jgi:hypothetical protein